MLGWAAPATSAHPACRLSDSWGKSILTRCLYSPCVKTTSCTMTGIDVFGSKCLWDITATFSPRLPQSGQNKETMITAVIQPFNTKLSRSAECQHKFADAHSSISSPSPDTLFLFICIIPVTLRLITVGWFAYLWLKLRTEVHTVNTVQQETNCCLRVWGDKDLQGGGWTWSILRFNRILTHTDRQCLQCTFQSPILC